MTDEEFLTDARSTIANLNLSANSKAKVEEALSFFDVSKSQIAELEKQIEAIKNSMKEKELSLRNDERYSYGLQIISPFTELRKSQIPDALAL